MGNHPRWASICTFDTSFVFRTGPLLLLLLLFLTTASGDDGKQINAKYTSKWFLSLGMANNHPQLKAAEDQIDTEVNHTFQLIAPGFGNVKTFQDQASDFMVWTPFISIGRKLTTRWDVFAQVGYTTGKVHTKGTDASLLLLPLHTEVSFKRSAFFAGMGVEWFPWEMPEVRKYATLAERLKGARPFLGTTLNYNYLTADANVKAGFVPFVNLLHIEQREAWQVWNSSLVIGLDIPLGSRTTLCANVTYNTFFDHGYDFSGPSASLYWQWHF